jgi:hypothetical protein
MKKITAFLAAVAFCAVCSVYADWGGSDHGAWPKSWPKELEPLRKQSGTMHGGEFELVIHRIPFAKREDFESAWPHLLKVKSKGAPVILVRSPMNHWHFGKTNAGVLIHCPPSQTINPTEPATPLAGQTDPRVSWLRSTFIELVVDGSVVDLNRIALPADTPIIDERF